MRRDIACASGVPVLPPCASQPGILFQNLQINILKLRGFHSMGEGKATDTRPGDDYSEGSWMVEGELGLFVSDRILFPVRFSRFDWV